MRRVSRLAGAGPCRNCKARRPKNAHRYGWRGIYCHRCSERWRYNGRPAEGPPPSRQQVGGRRAGRIEDYAELRSWGESMENAATRLGVSFRTVQRYEAELRRQKVTVDEAAARIGVTSRTATRYAATLRDGQAAA